jgi:hypothetical protein
VRTPPEPAEPRSRGRRATGFAGERLRRGLIALDQDPAPDADRARPHSGAVLKFFVELAVAMALLLAMLVFLF